MWWQRGLLAVLLGGCTAIAPFGRFATGDAGADAGPPDDAGTGGMKRVFLSSMRYGGDLSGVAGADARCSALAGAQGLPPTLRACRLDPFDSMTHASRLGSLSDSIFRAMRKALFAAGMPA